jgi:large subunit ribosomal protein L15
MTSLSLHSVAPAKGSKTKRFRIGRGNASGSGTTAGRGTKGQRARTGGRNRLKLKGMKQMLLRIPKNRGFQSHLPHPTAITLTQLDAAMKVPGKVTLKDLQKKRVVARTATGVKLLNSGKLTKALTLVDVSASVKAREAVIAAGGSFESTKKEKRKAKSEKK